MEITDRVQNLLMEIEYLEKTLDILEIGFEQCTYGDNKSEIASIHVVNRYLEMIQKEYIEKIAELLSDI